MKTKYENNLGNERSVEVPFMIEMIEKYFVPGVKILDVGGIPSCINENKPITDLIEKLGVEYYIADFRGGDFHGDFIKYDFGDKTFDIILFLSSLEHFPQCTEGDMQKREGEDKRGFEKALSLLNPGGHIILTVPFGKQRWQPYHQNYNYEGIMNLSEGSVMASCTTYRLIDNVWTLTVPDKMEDVLYEGKAYGVGCFVFRKEN